MVMEDGFGPDFLSGEEIRELLREGPVPDSDPPADSGRGGGSVPLRVLLISRGGGDAALVRSRLEATGMSVHAVRNPFMALDQLRASPHHAVVSDFDLWANDASLLCERLRQGGKELPVVFLGNPREDRNNLETRARRAGAWGVLPRPFHAGEVETTAQNLLEAARSASTPRGGGGGSIFPPRSPQGDEIPPRSSQGDEIAPRSAEGDGVRGELLWLRFYFQLSQALQSSASGRVPPQELLELARKAFSPGAVGVFYERGGRVSACLDVSAADVSSDVGASTCGKLLGLRARRSGVSSDGNGDLTLHFGALETSARATITLAGLSAAACEAADAFLPEIRRLLQGGLG